MNTLLKTYAGQPQADIYRAVCRLTDQILKLRSKTGYGVASDLQRLRRQRAELQSLLTKPTLVWSAP